MRLLSRFSTAPALLVRVAGSLAAIVSFGAGLTAYVNGRVPAGENLPLAGALPALVAAVTRPCRIPLPGTGLSPYGPGGMLLAPPARAGALSALSARRAMC